MTDSLLQKVVKKTKNLTEKDNHATPNYLDRILSLNLDLITVKEEGICDIDDIVLNYYYYQRLKSEASLTFWGSLPKVPDRDPEMITWSVFTVCLAGVNGLKDKHTPLTIQNAARRLKRTTLFSKVDFRRNNAKSFVKYLEAYRKAIYG